MALIDVVTLITPNAAGLGNNYLQGSTPSFTYVGPPNGNGEFDLVYVKGLKGYPWDWLVVGNDYIRELVTENIWGDPTTGKVNMGRGVRRFPRWIDYTYPVNSPSVATAPSSVPGLIANVQGSPAPAAVPVPGSWQFLVQRPETDYVIYGPPDPKVGPGVYGYPTSRNTDNYVRCTFTGPFPALKSGDLPVGEDWILNYEWSGKLVGGVVVFNGVRERVYHRCVMLSDGSRASYGRYAWDTSKWSALLNDYDKPNGSSLDNKIAPIPSTGLPKPVQMIF